MIDVAGIADAVNISCNQILSKRAVITLIIKHSPNKNLELESRV